MPAKSSKQRTLACIAMSMKNGKTPANYSKQAERMMKSMSTEELRHMCEMKPEK